MARIVYYWGYPAVDEQGRHSMWDIMKGGPGLMFDIAPGAPGNTTAGMSTRLTPSQRIVVTSVRPRSASLHDRVQRARQTPEKHRP